MKFIIGNDIHLGSKHATHTLEQVQRLIVTSRHYLIFNGDIVDMANSERKLVGFWREKLQWIADNTTFIRGNHELNQVHAPDSMMINGIYITHGDYMFWSEEKADAYRAKKPGAGWLKRWFTPVYDHLRHFADGGPNELFFQNADKIIEHYNPRAIVVGHRHPKENIIFDYKGVKCYILKRGIQTLDLGAM